MSDFCWINNEPKEEIVQTRREEEAVEVKDKFLRDHLSYDLHEFKIIGVS